MNTNLNLSRDEFATEVTAFVDDFVRNATPEEIDSFLREGDADFYNGVVSPEMVSPPVESSALSFHGSFWSMLAWPLRIGSEGVVDFKIGHWHAQASGSLECADRPDLALAA